MPGTIPEINWFELEVLNLISMKPDYGQQLLHRLESMYREPISSGKLYPVLQKLEKKGFMKRSDLEKGKFFYTITEEGQTELFNATKWALHSLLTTLTRQLAMDVSAYVEDKLEKEIANLEKENKTIERVAVFEEGCKSKAEALLYPFAGKFSNVSIFSIHHEKMDGTFSGKACHTYGSIPNITELVSTHDDIPLKDEFVDSAVMILSFHESPDREAYMKEVLRILKPGGVLFIIEFARFESYILESLFNILHTEEGEQLFTFEGMDEEYLRQFVDGHLDGVTMERIKEMIVCSGRKKVR